MADKKKTWRFLIRHTCKREVTLTITLDALATFTKENPEYAVEVAPISYDKPVMGRMRILGVEVIVGIMLQDNLAFGSIIAPESMSWAESLVRQNLEATAQKLLTEAGSEHVEIEYPVYTPLRPFE